MFLKGIILICSKRIKDARTSSAIYHIIKGKRGIQTLHDAQIFQLSEFFGIYKSLDRTSFEKAIKKLQHNALIEEISLTDKMFKLTIQGEKWLEQHKQSMPFHYFNGLKFNGLTSTYFERLLLLIQTFTNSKSQHFSFIPIINHTDITNWVKRFYRNMKLEGDDHVLSLIYRDLLYVLEKFTEREAEFFLDHLTGYKKYGMSTDQLANKYQMEKIDVPLLRTAIIHHMLAIIANNKTELHILPLLIHDFNHQKVITHTANVTYDLLKQGHDIERISRIRRLKKNTIYDHIVEISLFNTDFPINKFVSVEAQEEIINAINATHSYKLKHIKNAISSHIDYFQIRLVLAGINTKQKIGDKT